MTCENRKSRLKESGHWEFLWMYLGRYTHMQITAIPVARIIAILEITDLDPQGKINYPELFGALVDRYKFHKFPQKPEEFDLQKGVVFDAGRWTKGSVEKLTIFGG